MTSSGAVKGRSTAAGSERGSITGIAILLTAILLLMGLSFLGFATTDNTMVTNEIRGKAAFNLADAGIEHARRLLITVDPNTILQNTLTSAPFRYLKFSGGGGVCTTMDMCPFSMSGGSYSVRVENNMSVIKGIAADPSGSATNDTEGTLILTSSGTYRGATRVIEAAVTIPKFPTPPGAITAYGNHAEVALEGGPVVVDGNNWAPPTAGACFPPGAGCVWGLDATVDSIPGVTFNSSLAQLEFQSPAQVLGGNPSPTWYNTNLRPDSWRALASSLIPGANRTVTSAGGTITTAQTWGTLDHPEITYVTGTSAVTVGSGGHVTGAGVLIVDVKFQTQYNGAFDFAGLVLVLDNGKMADHELETEWGIANVYGGVIAIPGPTTSELEVELKGSSVAKYSKYAITLAQNIAMGNLATTLLTWREVP